MGFFYCVLSYSILGLAFAFLVAAALVPNGILGRIRVVGSETLAVWSYAIYLTHVLVLEAAADFWGKVGLRPNGIGMALFSIGCVLASGAALHFGVERVFLRIRDKRAKTASPRVQSATL